jgi:hypothetical protein
MKPPELRLSTNRSSEAKLAEHKAPARPPLTGRAVPGPGVEGPDQETQYDARQEEEGSTDSTSRRL